ncbi:MAG: Card1-like endonuclease domain-containing protein [bacterium]
MNEHDRLESLILLVGSNPLPNYLAAMALKPLTVHLVHSDETKRPKERLHVALKDDLGSGTTIDGDAYVDDAFSASVVTDKVRGLIESGSSAHLHYTGGTKVMSAHALKAFYKEGGQPASASYLDEEKVCVRFDDGRSTSLSDSGVSLTLDRILQLHGVTQKSRSLLEGGPGQDDVRSIATAVLQSPQLASCLYGEKRRLEDSSFSEAKATPCNASDRGLVLSAPVIPPAEGMTRKCYEAWRDFIGGEWLEEWVAAKVREIGLANDPEVTVGVNCTRDETNRPFEVDAAVVRRQRSYFISCTTDMTRNLCKSKAFEILVRSRHMGGDLARSALVSLLPANIVVELQADIADAWGSANATRVFGLEDMKTWSGHYGSPNLGSLKDWLES